MNVQKMTRLPYQIKRKTPTKSKISMWNYISLFGFWNEVERARERERVDTPVPATYHRNVSSFMNDYSGQLGRYSLTMCCQRHCHRRRFYVCIPIRMTSFSIARFHFTFHSDERLRNEYTMTFLCTGFYFVSKKAEEISSLTENKNRVSMVNCRRI